MSTAEFPSRLRRSLLSTLSMCWHSSTSRTTHRTIWLSLALKVWPLTETEYERWPARFHSNAHETTSPFASDRLTASRRRLRVGVIANSASPVAFGSPFKRGSCFVGVANRTGNRSRSLILANRRKVSPLREKMPSNPIANWHRRR